MKCGINAKAVSHARVGRGACAGSPQRVADAGRMTGGGKVDGRRWGLPMRPSRIVAFLPLRAALRAPQLESSLQPPGMHLLGAGWHGANRKWVAASTPDDSPRLEQQ